MKNKTKISVLILVLSVFVLTTVFLFACGNETDKKEGIDTTTPESTAATSSPEVTTAPKSETTAPETTVSQTEEVTTAPLPTKTEVVEFYTRHKAKATDIADSGYDIIDSLEKYNSYKTACMNDYTDGKKVFEEFEAAMEFDGTQAFFDKYYIVSAAFRGYYLNGINYSDAFYPAHALVSVKKDSVVFDYAQYNLFKDRISTNGDTIFRSFCRIEKTFYRDKVELIFDESISDAKLIDLPYTVEQSAMLYDESDAHVGQGPLSYFMIKDPQKAQNVITSTRVEGVWENKYFSKTVQEIIQKYDDKFFETHVLFGMSIYTPTNNIFTVKNVYYLYDTVHIDVEYEYISGSTKYLYDMVCEKVYTFVEVPKDKLTQEFWDKDYSNLRITLNEKAKDLEYERLYHKLEISVES